jgi:hypothetical protein
MLFLDHEEQQQKERMFGQELHHEAIIHYATIGHEASLIPIIERSEIGLNPGINFGITVDQGYRSPIFQQSEVPFFGK